MYIDSVCDLQSVDNRLVHLAIKVAISNALQLEVRVTFLQQQQQQQQHAYITGDVNNFHHSCNV